jgi:hypothetical protein
MSNHLVRGLTTTNTKKRKKLKFSSAEEKRQHEAYCKWKQELVGSLKPAKAKPNKLKVDYSHVRETAYIPSKVETSDVIPAKKETRVYDGERKLLGIATLHKSVMQPVFDTEYAKEVARMRRG